MALLYDRLIATARPEARRTAIIAATAVMTGRRGAARCRSGLSTVGETAAAMDCKAVVSVRIASASPQRASAEQEASTVWLTIPRVPLQRGPGKSSAERPVSQ